MNHPQISTRERTGTRRVVVQQFPYSIFYRMETASIVVIAISHASRDPRGWMDRI